MWKYKLSALVLMNMCLVACKQNPNNLLEDARLKLNAANYISYDQSAFYPNPMGTINTLKASVVLKKNSSSFLGYDFLFQSNTTDDYFRNGEYRLVKKNEKIINIFPVEQADQMESSVRSGRNIQFSPMTFLNEDDWSYVNDTLQNTVRYSSFKRVETDTIIDGNEIYTALYIFINSKTKLMERFERRNFYRGELSQTVVYRYDDYSFGDDNMELTYTIPKDFVTVPFGQNDKDRITHNPGDSAPDFEGTDLNIRLIKKEDFQDKKLVLMFSVINCGYCKLAIENLTNEKFQLSESVSLVAIYPLDTKINVSRYMEIFDPSFPVIAEAKVIGENYGVFAFPTFFIINQSGEIDKVVQGYQKEFLESLRTNSLSNDTDR